MLQLLPCSPAHTHPCTPAHLHHLVAADGPVTQPQGVYPAVHHTAGRLVHVDKAAAGVDQRPQLPAACCKVQHCLCAAVVGCQCRVDVTLQSYVGRGVQDHVQLLLQLLGRAAAEAQAWQRDVPRQRTHLGQQLLPVAHLVEHILLRAQGWGGGGGVSFGCVPSSSRAPTSPSQLQQHTCSSLLSLSSGLCPPLALSSTYTLLTAVVRSSASSTRPPT